MNSSAISSSIVFPVVLSFLITAVIGPVVIPFLRRLKVGQTVRDEGPQAHLKKNGTPTMGGIMILFSIVVTSLFYVRDYPNIIPILFLTLGFGLIGFLDDYIKVVLKRSMGLKVWQKMVLQFAVTGVFAYYLTHYTDVSLAMRIPFWEGHYLDFGVLNIPILFFIVIGTVNGTNFTDGSGWSGKLCNCCSGCLFCGGSNRLGKWNCADQLCCDWCIAWFFIV